MDVLSALMGSGGPITVSSGFISVSHLAFWHSSSAPHSGHAIAHTSCSPAFSQAATSHQHVSTLRVQDLVGQICTRKLVGSLPQNNQLSTPSSSPYRSKTLHKKINCRGLPSVLFFHPLLNSSRFLLAHAQSLVLHSTPLAKLHSHCVPWLSSLSNRVKTQIMRKGPSLPEAMNATLLQHHRYPLASHRCF